jgi:hypothetical protein
LYFVTVDADKSSFLFLRKSNPYATEVMDSWSEAAVEIAFSRMQFRWYGDAVAYWSEISYINVRAFSAFPQ